MMNARIRRRYAVYTALVIGALLIGCSHQQEGTTEITIFPGTEPIQTVATEPLVEATGDTTPTESVKATELPAMDPPATEPPPTEPPATEPPATEPEIILDYDTAMAYGNQYAADTYGYYIDLSLNADNAGFEFPYSASVHGIIAKGGQDYLHLRIARKVDSLAESLSARGISKAYISCYIYEDADGIVQFYVYYG